VVGASSALSTDVSWQLAKDADGPDRKMKNTRKFGFSEYVKSDKKIGNLKNLKKSETDIRNRIIILFWTRGKCENIPG
jgi:hypothetical protein